MFKVMREKCNECLFSGSKIVSDKRRRQVLSECRQSNSHFICHKATIAGESICCRGFYDTQTSNLMRIAQRLNAVEFVDEPVKPK